MKKKYIILLSILVIIAVATVILLVRPVLLYGNFQTQVNPTTQIAWSADNPNEFYFTREVESVVKRSFVLVSRVGVHRQGYVFKMDINGLSLKVIGTANGHAVGAVKNNTLLVEGSMEGTGEGKAGRDSQVWAVDVTTGQSKQVLHKLVHKYRPAFIIKLDVGYLGCFETYWEDSDFNIIGAYNIYDEQGEIIKKVYRSDNRRSCPAAIVLNDKVLITEAIVNGYDNKQVKTESSVSVDDNGNVVVVPQEWREYTELVDERILNNKIKNEQFSRNSTFDYPYLSPDGKTFLSRTDGHPDETKIFPVDYKKGKQGIDFTKPLSNSDSIESETKSQVVSQYPSKWSLYFNPKHSWIFANKPW